MHTSTVSSAAASCHGTLNHPESTERLQPEECKADWMEEHGEDSCAGDDWICIGESSEYDYFFVNLRKTSPHFGMVKHIVNNCDEDPDLDFRQETAFSEAPFDRFLDIVESFAEQEANEDEDDCEPLHSFNFRALQRKKKKT
eukprot:s931_g6.t1